MGAFEKILGLNEEDGQQSDKQRNYPTQQNNGDGSAQPGGSGEQQPASQAPAVQQPAAQQGETHPNGGTGTVQVPKPTPLSTQQTQEETQKPHMSYVEMMQQLSPYHPPTQDEIEAERKRMKRDAVFAAIGDGLNAFHQAYSYSRGVKPMTDDSSMTDKVRERYEKERKEREAYQTQYLNAYMRASQADDANRKDERNWRRTIERDEASDKKDQRDFDFRKTQADQQQQNWQQQFDRQSEQWKKEFEMREKQYGRQNTLAWANHNLQVQAQKDNKELREKQIDATTAKAVRGRQLTFSDGNSSLNIYENVWKGSMEQVYDAIVADFDEQRKNNSNANVPRGLPRKATAQQKDDYVKQHWHKSSVGRQMMQTLSGIDPANMTGGTQGDYSQYETGGNNQDDYSQYEVTE
ncbi:MAG: hypothetical protein IJS63_09210 [Bacteroidaceae bacterium]|nr:hypothetical protein [Bacteroidaceae bacterium]